MKSPLPAKKTNAKRRVLAIIGTRPEAIKMAPLIKALQTSGKSDVAVCATGQHTDMVFPILDWFGVSRDYTLDVMTHGQPLSHLAGRLLSGLHDVIAEVHPDVITVQGDTTSAFIGGLAAYYSYDHFWKNQLRDTPMEIAHIDAGLRTGDNYSPYPEEVNRRLLGHMAHWNFAPTIESSAALYREGITKNVFVTGNTVIDALFATRDIINKTGRNPLPQIPSDKRIVLVTSHRRENYGEGLKDICHAIKTLAERYESQGYEFVFPVHLNKNVQEPVHEMLGGVKNIHLIKPQDYPDFVALMMRSYLILTDSGGVQEEGPSLGKPILVMRDNTERPEAITAGTARLVTNKSDKIIAETCSLLDNELLYNRMAHTANPYGDGFSSERIVNLLNGGSSQVNTFIYQAA